MVAEEIRKIIQEFANRVSEWGIRIDRVILYGSYARGCAHKFSDIDVAIISPDFGKDRLEERSRLFRLAVKIDARLEPISFSTRAFEEDTWVPIIYEIKKTGMEIAVG